jgi:23S rRNA (guanosine2251-2'-O)-methyltransferase
MNAKIPTSVLILHNIRSAENVGSLFRTADAVGIAKIYLSSITPTPIDRFGRPNAKVVKTALGAESSVEWEQYGSIESLLEMLRAQGFQTIAIEQSDGSVDYKDIEVGENVAFILGNEVEGINPEILSLVDSIAEIPMSGRKESLNVSVAGGIALFRMLGR